MITMNKRGVILIFSLFVALILSGLLGAFYFQSISENQLATRYADSTRALWLAEAGIAKVKSNLGITAPSDLSFDGNSHYKYIVDSPTLVTGTTDHYNIVSRGTVTSPSGRPPVTRAVSVTMKLIPPDASKLQYGVETTSLNMSYQDKNIVNAEYPGQKAKTGSTLTFSDLFGVTKVTLEALATHLTDPVNTINTSGITWVDVTGSLLEIEHLNGSGVLIIEGDFKLTGSGSFDGILYVIGSLTIRGNPLINGTVFVESSADVNDTVDLQGSPGQIVYQSQAVANALIPLTSSKSVVSWQEI